MNESSKVIRIDEKGIYYAIGKMSNYKKVTFVELEAAFHELHNNYKITHEWFKETFPKQANSAPCNFTTIGGLLQYFEIAVHTGRGVYSNKN